MSRIKKELKNLKWNRINNKDKEELKTIFDQIDTISEDSLSKLLLDKKDYLTDFFERYSFHKISRFVDFNQGLDARLFTEEKAKKMSEIALRPCRIAFDSLSTKDDYLKAMETAVKYGIKNFSNYLLYNYDEKPESLWMRLKINIDFCKNHEKEKLSLFSFPMKYASIERTDRNYVGKEWHKKYLRAINIILNVTSGIVAKEEDFFLRAYGHTEKEFIEILSMPDDFIRYRDYFEEIGFTKLWKQCYLDLGDEQKETLIDILDRIIDDPDLLIKNYDEQIDRILLFYSIKKNRVEKNSLFYNNMMNKLKKDIYECSCGSQMFLE